MVKYREENLLYFKSLDDLHMALGINAKCVAILYQFRNCVIRDERSITCYAKANVTGEFDKVGGTYCTTNDVRGWFTYRPYYKIYFADKTVADHTYQYNWVDSQRNPSAQITDPDADDYTPAVYGFALPPSEFIHGVPDDAQYDHSDKYTVYTQDNEYPVMVSAYTDYYTKTRYRNGVKVGGTHNGMENGNTLLLYSVDTSIDLNVETKIAGSNTVKETYTITYGERDVKYRVTPHITIASGVTKTELTRNGTQSTEITIVINVPKYLSYIPGSLVADYTHSDYEDGALVWDVSSSPGDEGSTVITIKTFVSDIDKVLPELFYDCHIGDESNSENDIPESGTSLVTYAEIQAKYAETNLMAAQTHSDTASINILKVSQDGISESTEEYLLELGDDIEYILTYANSTPDSVNDIQAVSVLPHNGDGRSTQFTGGYKIKSFIIEFSSDDDCDTFVSGGGSLSLTDDDFKWAVPSTSSEQNQYYEGFYTDSSIARTTLSYTRDGTKKLVYDASSLGRAVYAYDPSDQEVNKAPALYAAIPRIGGNGRFNIRVILSPKVSESGTTLIESGTGENNTKTQTGGNIYSNSFIYRKRSSATSFFTPISSNIVGSTVIKRSASGVVWMDQDHDGLYNTPQWVAYNNGLADANKIAVEYPIANLKVTLYKLTGAENTMSPAVDVLGNEIAPKYTDEKGKYVFENLPTGNYAVIFDDDENKYRFMSTDPNMPEQPLEFEKLSVTSTVNSQANRGNKFVPVYSESSDTALNKAKLYDMVINMPEKNMVPTSNYISTDWNLGLYFQDITVHKTWENMIYGIPSETTIVFDIEGKEQGSGNVVYGAEISMTNHVDPVTNPDGEVKGYFTEDGGTAEPVNLTIVNNDADHTVIWDISDDDRIFLRGENENGGIDYTIREIRTEHYGRNVSEFYNINENDDIDDVTKNRIHNITNSQILGSITIMKQTGGDEALEGAEFSLYQVYTKGTPDSVDYYGSKEGVGVTLTDANRYAAGSTTRYYKVRIGNQAVLDLLKDLGMYNSESNILTITRTDGTEEQIVHKEISDGTTYYYYNTTVTESFSYEMILGGIDEYNNLINVDHLIDSNDMYYHSNGKTYPVLRRRVDGVREFYITVSVQPSDFEKVAVVEFENLPLYNLNGDPIYYTVRETKEPNGYVSLGNFKSLTGLDLYNGGYNATHDFSFAVVNNKEIELPLSGENPLFVIIMIGTILTVLGSVSFVLLRHKKKHGQLPIVLVRFLE